MSEYKDKPPGSSPRNDPVFPHRACYINHGEHLLNHWNANLIYPRESHQWTLADWRKFFRMLKAFGYTNFQFWLVPTMFDLPSLKGGGIYRWYADTMQQVAELAHAERLEVQCLCNINVWGPKWYYACPNNPRERSTLLKLWKHWMRELSGIDAVTLFPGDLGGCNLNGCNHETAVDLDLEIAGIAKCQNPKIRIEIGTWGNPFCGWGTDSVEVPGWNQSAVDLMTSGFYGFTNRDFHGNPERAKAAFRYLIKHLPHFPDDTMVAVNPSLNQGGDGSIYAREIAGICPIVTWDYYVSEGEGSVQPHWNLQDMANARRAECKIAPYIGGICYSMTPKLNLLTLYGGAQTFIDPQAESTELSTRFFTGVFGAEHEELGTLMKVFKCKPFGDVSLNAGTPSGNWKRKDWHRAFGRIIEHLQAVNPSACTLPIFPDPEIYRQDLLWFAEIFHEMTGPNPNRSLIAWQYWDKVYAIYQKVPMGALAAENACRSFANTFCNLE